MIKIGPYSVKLCFDKYMTPVKTVLSHPRDAGSVVDITISDPPLEEVIATMYQLQDSHSFIALSAAQSKRAELFT